jgi:DNA-binding transcriptional ArsR family regulator
LTNFSFNTRLSCVHVVEVIEEPEAARSALEPTRARILALLAQPGSASSVATTLNIPRQQINYHLRALEEHGLVRFIEERPKRGLRERIVQSTAHRYVIASPHDDVQTAAASDIDRVSADYVIALGAQLIRDIATLRRHAQRLRQTLPTLAIDTEIRFASAADRKAFSEELAGAITHLAAKYHHEHAPNGRWHRLVVAAHPSLSRNQSPPDPTQGATHEQ